MYYEAVYMMRQMIDGMPEAREKDERTKQLLEEKIEQYQERARRLLSLETPSKEPTETASCQRDPHAPNCYLRLVKQSHNSGFQQDYNNYPIISYPSVTLQNEKVPLAHSSLWKLCNNFRKQAAAQVADIVNESNSYIAKALDLDEDGWEDQASQEYSSAVDLFFKALNLVKKKERNIPSRSRDDIANGTKRRLVKGFGPGRRAKTKCRNQRRLWQPCTPPRCKNNGQPVL
ncbi:hypothetical protein ACA910_007369 [Epithemia clementina (nom. ined.)]